MKNFDQDIKQDFEWVYKILKSCVTENQVKIADVCLYLWLKKWDHLSNDRIYCHYLGSFKERYELYKTKKKLFDGRSTYISK